MVTVKPLVDNPASVNKPGLKVAEAPSTPVCGLVAGGVTTSWLSKAPMSMVPLTMRGKPAALVEGARPGVVAGINRGAAASQGQRLGRTAVVSQRSQQRIDVQQIAWLEARAARGVTDQIVALGADVSRNVEPGVVGNNSIQGAHYAAEIVNSPALPAVVEAVLVAMVLEVMVTEPLWLKTPPP